MKNRNLNLFFVFFLLFAFTSGLFAAPPHPPKGHGAHHPRPYPAFLENLPEAEQARFKKLFREDPDAFRKEMRAYWMKEFEKQKAELDAIGKRYRETEDPAARKQLEQELREKVTAQFEKHQKFAEKQIRSHENQIRQMQKRLEHLKAQTERKKKNQQNAIDQTVKKILEGAEKAASEAGQRTH